MKAIKVWRLFGLKGFLKGVYHKLQLGRIVGMVFRSLSPPNSILWEETYVPEDNSQVILYADDPALYREYWPRRNLQDKRQGNRLPVTVISTCKNEEKSAAQWLEALSRQTRLPDEIIVVDGGSSDRTVEILNNDAARLNLVLTILDEPDANIATARNIAIQNASSPLIASLDFGCIPDDDWLEKITVPFEMDSQTEVSAGWYQAVDRQGERSKFRGVPKLEEVLPQHFIPSSRSLAFTREAWEKAGKYPEWLTLTGEDTYFALELKRYCPHWAFVPEAVVKWKAPSSWSQMWQKTVYWATGDGEIGYNTSAYRYTLLKLVFAGMVAGLGIALTLGFILWADVDGWWMKLILSAAGWLAFAGILAVYSWKRERDPFFVFGMFGLYLSQGYGFWKGSRRRRQVTLTRLKETRGLFFVLAGVPIDDTGGGARSTQLALELIRQNFWVVYINRFPKHETQTIDLRIAHPNLMTFEFGDFNWEQFKGQYEQILPGMQKFAVVEFPLIEFMPLIERVKSDGGKMVYEMIDDWNSSLGGGWYTEEIEREFLQKSDLNIATAPILQQKMEKVTGSRVNLLPNAVNSRLFDPERLHRRPTDLPHADWIAIYIGALWGDWFDWDLLRAIATRYPEAAIVAVGDYHGQCENPPDNLKFLGLKPQSALPDYLAHVDVTIIPWKVNAITQATSPLKLYEYLAMRCPAVAPALDPLQHIPGVFLAKDNEEFIRLVGEVRRKNLPMDDINAFISSNNWQARILQLIEWLAVKD